MTKSLLIVDDEASMRRMYERLFAHAGYGLTLAGSVAEGRRLMAANRYDLLITDLVLGDGEGTELVKMAAWGKGGANAILISGSIGEREVPLCIEKYKLKDCFTKPFLAHSLLIAVKNILD